MYRPAAAGEAPLPAVLFMHGDAPPQRLRGARDWGQYVSWGQLIAASGLAAVTFNHRSTQGFARVYEAAEDIDALVAFVRDNAGRLGIDRDRLCLFVVSAGGPTGLRAELLAPDYVRFIVSYYAVMNLGPVPELPPGRAGPCQRQ